VITQILINGEVSAGTVAVTDSSVLRGDACFEVLRSYAGRPFAMDDHLSRLDKGAAAMAIELPPLDQLRSWIERTSAEIGDGAVRVVATRGSSVDDVPGSPNVIVFGHTWDVSEEPLTLMPMHAPWHAAGVTWELAGTKFTSYAPNLSATRRARSGGFGDALLLSAADEILEGPTFCVGWVHGETLQTPDLSLGILDSITRRLVIGLAGELGLPVQTGVWKLGQLEVASEVMAWSTIKEVQPVVAVGEHRWEPGLVTESLAKAFETLTGLGTNQH
jgi:branched-chain amino acid aminotransferase